jgi:hypothetical protein
MTGVLVKRENVDTDMVMERGKNMGRDPESKRVWTGDWDDTSANRGTLNAASKHWKLGKARGILPPFSERA